MEKEEEEHNSSFDVTGGSDNGAERIKLFGSFIQSLLKSIL